PLPIQAFQSGEIVLAEGGETGQLLFLQAGGVEVVKDGVRISKVAEPGAVFGEMAALLDRPHSADVRTLKPSTFHVVDDGKKFLASEPEVALQVAMILAQRLDALNRYLLDVRDQFRQFEDHVGMIDEVIETIVNRHPRRVDRRGARGA
ncbi:MAG: cyclic nucleotide-binding domain-containing protein, partial [Pseudomonadota bacterium]